MRRIDLALCLLCLSAPFTAGEVVCQLELRIDTVSDLTEAPPASVRYDVVNVTRTGGSLLVDLDYFGELDSDVIKTASELILTNSFSTLFGAGTVVVESASECAECDCEDGDAVAASLRQLHASLFGMAGLGSIVVALMWWFGWKCPGAAAVWGAASAAPPPPPAASAAPPPPVTVAANTPRSRAAASRR
jgi:hypothetical protein